MTDHSPLPRQPSNQPGTENTGTPRSMVQGVIFRHPIYGMGLAFLGALIITPDTLLIRLSGLEAWSLTVWRGLLVGISLLVIWAVMARGQILKDLGQITSTSFVVILFATTGNNIAFNFATIETSVTVVLTALATAPVLAAGLSLLVLKEMTTPKTWFAIMVTLLGVMIVIFNGDGATAAPTGNVLFGGLLGLMSALGLAVVFVFIRKSPNVPILLAVALGNILSGIIGFAGVSVDSLFSGSLWPVLLMGFGVMPLAMALLSTAPRYTAPTNVTLFMLLEMVLGPFWVWLGTGEQPSFMMIFGATIVLATLIIYILSSAKNET